MRTRAEPEHSYMLVEPLTLAVDRVAQSRPFQRRSEAEWLDELCVNIIRTLSMDLPQRANGEHPGTSMAFARVAYYLWQRILRYDPEDPIWPNRDRFFLSLGHASTLLYSLLHLSGARTVSKRYQGPGEPSVPCDAIKKVGELDRRCPGHPEHRWISAVETTTVAVRQDVETSVGKAIAGKWMAMRYNQPGYENFIDFNVYVLCGDGCLMESLSERAAFLAADFKLSNLCWIYDNKITVEGNTAPVFSEDVATRFVGYGWNVRHVRDANDLMALDRAFSGFISTPDRPTLIMVDNKVDTCGAHGTPLGETELPLTKREYTGSQDAQIHVPESVYDHFKNGIGKRGAALREAWFAKVQEYKTRYPQLGDELYYMQHHQLPVGWDKHLPGTGCERH
jgi:transketolase